MSGYRISWDTGEIRVRLTVARGLMEVCSAMDGAAQALQGGIHGRPPKDPL